VLAALVAIPFILVAAVASSILTDFGFTLVRVGSDLHLRRGLLDQREATLSLQRIQVLRVHENLVRRALGICAVEMQSAGSGTAAEGAVSRVTIPLVRTAKLDELLGLVLPAAVDRPELIAAPPAARRRAWVRGVLVPATVLLAFVAFWVITESAWAAVAVLVIAPLVVGAELAYRNLGHVATSTIVVARGGGYVRTTSYVPVAKTQSTRLRSSWFQRRVGLATLSIDVAGRGRVPTVADGDAGRLVRLRHDALNATVAKADEDLVRRRARGAA
jgi:putative membrane protein